MWATCEGEVVHSLVIGQNNGAAIMSTWQCKLRAWSSEKEVEGCPAIPREPELLFQNNSNKKIKAI